MLLPIKAICDSKKIRKDGTSLIFIQYCYSSERRTLLNTEIAIPPRYWNKKKRSISTELPSEFGNYEFLNEEIRRMIRLVEDIVSLAEKEQARDRGAFVKNLFNPNTDIPSLITDERNVVKAAAYDVRKLDLFDQIDDYIKSKEKKVSKGMLNVYRLMKDRIIAYQGFRKKRVTFECIDYNFYEAFIDYLTFDYVHQRRKEKLVGLKINTIGQTIKQFRIFIKDRIRRRIIPPIDLTDFKILDEETDAIYLSNEEVAAIYHTDLSGYEYLIEYRDLFVLACLTGLRFSDFSTLRPEDLRKGMLYKKQDKSDHWVVIPLRKEAKQIFTQRFKEQVPKLTNAEFNRHIKMIGKLAGLTEKITFSYKKGNKDIRVAKSKYDWITSHTARRSFCTNEFLAGTPVKLIMTISGHKSEADFYRYIRITPEEAAGKIKELWLQRNDLEAFGNQLQRVS